MRQFFKTYQFVTVFLIILLVPAFAMAQEDLQQAATLDTVTVTANKQEENVHEVPQAITVISEEIMEEKGIKSVADVIKQVPNMASHEDYHGHPASFRGLNTSIFTSKNPVVIYIDGIPMSDMFAFEASLTNAKRVEILRGPQGSLYGKDAIGAVINIITKDPRNQLNGNIGLEYSSFNTIDSKCNLSSPLIDEKLYFGLHARGYTSDGYMTNDYTNDDKANKREKLQLGGYLLARPLENLSVRLNLSYEDKNEYGERSQGLAANTKPSEFSRAKSKHYSRDIKEKNDDTVNNQSLNISYEFDNLKIASITTHKKLENKGVMDPDKDIQPAFAGLSMGHDLSIEEYTQELRFSNNSENVTWVAGLYADEEKADREPLYSQSFMSMDAYTNQKANTYAAFAQAKFSVVDKLDLTLGGRLQRFKKKINSRFYMYNNGTARPSTPSHSYKSQKTWDTFLPKLALDYKLTGNLMPYVSVSKGYMPGGFNHFAMSGGDEKNSFEPQKSTNYELGLKGAYKAFTFAANVFYMDIRDIHVMKMLPGFQIQTSNAKKAHSQGVELDFTYRPTSEIELSGNFGYVDAKYDNYDAGTTKYDDKKIEYTPNITANLGVGYYHDSGLYGRIDGKYTGKTYFTQDNTASDNGGFVADMKLGYKVGDFDIYAFAKNITDEEYVNYYFTSPNFALATFNEPRSFGLGVNYKF